LNRLATWWALNKPGLATTFCQLLLVGVFVGSAPAHAAGQPPSLSLPLECGTAAPCIVQNYADRDPGPEARDYRCGELSYDGHKGTDFRVTDLRKMRRGVTVRASARGKVIGLRNDYPEHEIEGFRPESVKGRECGNGVVLDHGSGWTTQYCHMRTGSVSVVMGQRLNAGETLGLIGMSGNTNFPHVHLSLRHDNRIIDPFVGLEVTSTDHCERSGPGLWTAAARRALPYRSSGVVRAGFAATAPKMPDIYEGLHDALRLPRDGARLFFWVQIFGLQVGDVEEFVVVGPDGKRFIAHRGKPATKSKADWLKYVGKVQKSNNPWLPGLYRGGYRLLRVIDGKPSIVFQVTRQLILE